MALEDRRLMSTFTVTDTADSGAGSLRYEIALANSNAGDNTIDFDSAVFNTALAITLTGSPLELSNTSGTETIMGPAAGVTVSGGGLSRVFEVDSNVQASISGLTITGGGESGVGAGLANYGGTASLTDCTISGNSAVSGGGLYTDQYGTTTLSNCTISGNSASMNGGGVYDFVGTTTLSNCTVSGNSAANGGGLYNFVGTTTLTNVLVSGNSANNGGGLSILFGTTTLNNCTFSGDAASVNGGGLYSNGGTTTLNYCTFSGDSASVSGGGLYNNGGTTTLNSCTFSGDSASVNGGGLANLIGTTTLTDCTVSGNSAGHGGGLYNLRGSTELADSLVSGNFADSGGGLSTYDGTTTVTDSTINGNSADSNGGGAFNDLGTTTLLNCSVAGNSATSGGGVGNDHYGTTMLTDCTVSGNSASGNGGGVDTNYSTTTVTNCTVSGNSAGNGGGLSTDNHGTTMLTDCTVSGNATVSGGGLDTDDYGATTLTNCTISGNSASDNGGGMYTTSSGTATLTSVTVSSNSAGSSGGGLYNVDGTVIIGNTIVAQNTATRSGTDALGIVASQGNNLIGATDGSSGWVGSDLTGTSSQPLNALLAPLGYYGGPSQTMALLPGSPAIDAGNNALIPAGVTTDQRGLPRIVDGVVDIGAFESSLFTIVTTSGSGQSTGIFTAFSNPLVATVIANNPIEPVAGGLVTFTPPQSGASANLTGSPATISATGTATVTAIANGTVGSYTVSAGARGITDTASFSLINQAIPQITTTPSITAVTLGTSPVTLKDTALLSDGYEETGTITFTLYLGNTLVDTETVPVNGDGAYTTPTGYTLPTTGTVTGTYQWDASYTGDTYNTPASENNAAPEQVTVCSANPAIRTTPNVTTVTLGTSSVTLNDVAMLSGGYYETGTITFTLYLGSTLVDTQTSSVTGNGTYTTPTGYTLPTTGTVTGTYQWDASYSGDSNNGSTSESNVAAEQVLVSPACPAITTTPSVTSVTLGASSVTLNDTAVLSGGYNETGTITFTLYLGSTLVDTETVSVSGNGSYTTPTGYTLPTTGTVTGTYQWDSSYSGDTNNHSTSENNAANEQTTVSPATPAITTTPSMTTITLGASSVTLNDVAVLSGGYYEAGTITFTLYLGSTLVDTETVSVTGNGTYTTPTGYTLPSSGTVIGTYQWNSTYSGDTNNRSTSENNAANEQVVVNPATPAITTTPSMTTVTLGTSSVTLNDTAVLSGGYHETGSITFTLYLGNTLVDTETVSVTGNGTYTTPTGYALPTTGTVTGTYQWDSSYNGDSNNRSTSENNVAAEQVLVSPASPTIITTPSMTAVTLSTSSVTLNDTAVLSGGYHETGTITFTLYLGSTLLDTETVSVSGNGTYATPTAYTLPTTGTVTGTYQWDASYASGNGNNEAFSENNAPAEQVLVSPANPSINTSPGGTISLGRLSISGTTYLDLTGNGFSTDDTPQSGVTIDLYEESNTCAGLQVGNSGDTLVASTTTASNGTYSFTVAGAGNYYVQESVPTGYVQTGGGPYGSAGSTYYTIAASSNHSYSGDNFDNYQIPTCTPTNVCYKVTTPSGCSQIVSNLSGNTAQGDTVTVTFTVPSGMNDTLTLVSYYAPSPSFSDSNAYQQSIDQQATGTFSPGTHSLTVSIPNSYYQIDFVCGAAINELEPNQNGDAYGPDSASILYHAQDRLISSDNGGTTAPSLPTPPTPMTPAPTTTSLTLTDSATLSGGYNPGGTIVFYLFAPGVTPNATDSNNVYSDTVTVSGNGTYTTASGTTTGSSVPTMAGNYEWVAVYSGDGNNNGVTSGYGSESETVSKVGPVINTTPGGPVTLGGMVNLTDTAVLSSGYNPGGTITFYLFAPGTTPNGTDSNNVYADTVTVNGNGTYTTSMGNDPGGYAATKTGTYEWLAVYSGDGNNNGASDTFGSEPETVNSGCSVGSGQYVTCAFWQSRNGQAVICGFDNGPNDTQLGNWLACNFPSLFGCSNPYISSYLNQCHATSLAGLTNTQVATLCTKLSTYGTSQNTYAQAFACALGIYADTSPFGGNATAQGYGFSVTWPGGSGGTWNVGSNNTPFGVSRNSSLSVCSILQNLNGNFSPSSGNFYGGNQSSTTAACNVLNGINTAGHISNGLTSVVPSGTVAYSPAQIRDAYGINDLSEDGSGQTIAIVDAYNDPDIFEAEDLFDSQFGPTDSGPTFYDQYGPAASFLTVLNQSGQTTSLPSTDPSGVGTDNWEVEEELDVEWAHAIAPGAQIILVEANSQSLSDLMASVATAAAQPGVSVVSMSWGFTEGQSVFAADEANYDSVFNVPGVTFLASTGDYGASDPQYPAFSPNVVAVGGTSLNLNADNSYNSETGWGYYSDSVGMGIGSGGGLSQYEPEPSYQEGVQSTGSRTTPDVSMVADPATGAWVADPYNLSSDNPFEVAGGTSLSAPTFAGLVALVDQGRVAAGEATLNGPSPTETQQALYSLPQTDYHSITSGSNGYTANAGYNLVTGLGTPVANLLVPDLIAYQGSGTSYAGPTVGSLQDATLSATWATGGGATSNVFDATLGSNGFGQAEAPAAGVATSMPMGGTLATVVASHASTSSPATAVASMFGPAAGHVSPDGSTQVLAWGTNTSAASVASQPTAGAAIAPTSNGQVSPMIDWSTAQPGAGTPIAYEQPSALPTTVRQSPDIFVPVRSRTTLVPDSVLDELAADPALWPATQGNGTITIPVTPTERVTRDLVHGDPLAQRDRTLPPGDYASGLAVLGLAAGFLARGTVLKDARKRQSRRLFPEEARPAGIP
jgi:parallel beta-helix repeat protein